MYGISEVLEKKKKQQQRKPNRKPWPQNRDMNRTVDFVNHSTPNI